MPNDTKALTIAKNSKADEFYTLYEDIEKEIYQYYKHNPKVFKGKVILCPCDDYEKSNFTKYFIDNFEKLGIKKLICTSYKEKSYLFKYENGIKSTILLDGNGDFRTEEIKKIRNKADIIVTNPPFSLFRDFVSWIYEAKKQFIIVGNVNAISYKEIFQYIKNNEMWLGHSIHSGDREFTVPDNYPLEASGCRIDNTGRKFIRVKGIRWFTNIDHGKYPEPLILKTMEENLINNKSLLKRLKKDYAQVAYPFYDNYNALEVPQSNAIPSDYDGVMGVPITFLDKYNPNQFKIVGWSRHNDLNMDGGYWKKGTSNDALVGGKLVYRRILIKKKHNFINSKIE